jgi:hypothetical protein
MFCFSIPFNCGEVMEAFVNKNPKGLEHSVQLDPFGFGEV